ncbi:MAG TPA: hypothetical protein VIZ17_17460 [Acetobacteraceae bacterium]
MRRNLIAVGVCAAAAGCATAPPAPAPVAQQKPAVSTDGTYRGTSTRFQADRRDCPHPGLVTLYVQDRQFEYRWKPQLYITAVIQPDGTVSGTGADVTLAGHQDDGTIDGDITNGACGLHFTAHKTF